jgi:hypothetical protein
MLFSPPPFHKKGTSLINVIRNLGLTSGLKLCLDAGDTNSYSGSGQSWLDLSGNGYDFFRGTSGSSQSSDPTFNGVSGRGSSSEYWSFDGADLFTYDSSNETWMNNMHKNNAKFTITSWFRFGTDGGQGLCGNLDVSGGNTLGWECNIGTLELFGFTVYNGAGSGGMDMYTTDDVSIGSWLFGAITVDEAAGTGYVQINGTQESRTTTYTLPSSSNSTTTMRIGDNGVAKLSNGSRMASISIWEGVSLSAQNLMDIYNLTRVKFGI